MQANGMVIVASGTEDIGSGIRTIMTQVVADALDIFPDMVDAKVGDTTLPESSLAAGSMDTASMMLSIQPAAM